ncbi:MAG: CBS domain-containing protein, partial [bacterium]
MDIIVGHENLDFDCVASMVAAQKLHPSARMFIQPTAEGPVREFLNLFRDHYSFNTVNDYSASDVETMIVVDTNRRDRLGPYSEALDHAETVILYDHHSRESADIDADEAHYDSVGALITYLVEIIRDRSIGLKPADATLFLLGLHQETGSLQFGSTSARDYAAGQFVLENGANLDVVQNFSHKPLSPEQLDLLNDLIDASRNLTINEVPITIATAKRDEYVPEVALLAHKLQDTENSNFLCLIVGMGERIQVVFRNRYDHIDVSKIAEQFGGGGHSRAASATLSGVTMEESEQALLQVFNQQLKPKLVARDIMSTPVHSIRPDLDVEEAQRIMLRLDHRGLPITDENNELVGIITRTDVSKAVKHDLTHAPVKGFMTPDVVTVDPDTSLERLQMILSNEQIGRLPVLENNQLIGIVTRTDIIRTLHQSQRSQADLLGEGSPYSTPVESENVTQLMEETLPDKWFRRVKNWGRMASRLGDSLYLVGGCVRDILLGERTKDFDFILEENAIRFGEELIEREGGDISTHEEFQTAVVTLPDGDRVDLATARSEYYTHPAALPEVEVEQVSLVQ